MSGAVDTLRLSAEEAWGLLERGEVSSDELVAAYRAAIDERDPELNCFLLVCDDSPGEGVPIAFKDVISTRGVETTAGSKILEGFKPVYDATVAERCAARGLRTIGKTNMDEFAMGSSNETSYYGPVKNPWDALAVPGGSSGGSAAAVAARLAPAATGTDTGGSIRQPAACCGIVGFKPTYDAVPREGVHPLAWSLDHIGPITRSVEDAGIAFEVMAGFPEHSMLPQSAITAPRIVKARRFFYDMLDDEVRAAMDAALARLRAAGAPVAEVDVPGIELAPGIQLITLASEGAQANWDLLAQHGDKLGEDVRLRLEIGQFYLAVDYIKAQQLRNQVRQSMIASFGDADVMIIPAMPVLPPKSGTMTLDVGGKTVHVAPTLTRFTSPINFCGFPALSMPCGKSGGGLPVNLQVVGRPGADATVLRVARWCEQVLSR
jgi:aspartyl-tRNA(Asn)/glutamyl-tRNA(Gln) amidotransferase subunit A